MISNLLCLNVFIIFTHAQTLLDGLTSELGNLNCEYKCKSGY